MVVGTGGPTMTLCCMPPLQMSGDEGSHGEGLQVEEGEGENCGGSLPAGQQLSGGGHDDSWAELQLDEVGVLPGRQAVLPVCPGGPWAGLRAVRGAVGCMAWHPRQGGSRRQARPAAAACQAGGGMHGPRQRCAHDAHPRRLLRRWWVDGALAAERRRAALLASRAGRARNTSRRVRAPWPSASAGAADGAVAPLTAC